MAVVDEQDWMYRNCSTTAQEGALDWSKDQPLKLY